MAQVREPSAGLCAQDLSWCLWVPVREKTSSGETIWKNNVKAQRVSRGAAGKVGPKVKGH